MSWRSMTIRKSHLNTALPYSSSAGARGVGSAWPGLKSLVVVPETPVAAVDDPWSTRAPPP